MAGQHESGREVLGMGARSLFLRCLSSLLLLASVFATGAGPAQAQKSFVSVAFHDVYDSESELDDDAITTDRLINFFEFLLSDGWTALTLDDVAMARQGKKVLPAKSILITFDDGYVSLYTRVFPLLQAYRFPIVAALVGQWMDAPMIAKVKYGDEWVPRTEFLTWAQAREMQASGLVEFASHSYDQHLALTADRHGTQIPALATYAFEAQANQYEDERRFASRVRRDMQKNTALLSRELGKRPRAFVWPYGRYSLHTIELAREMGYEFALNLNDEPSTADLPMEIARYLPEHNPTLGQIMTDLRHEPGLAPVTRIMSFDLAEIWTADQTLFDRQLGEFIEDVRQVAPTAVMFKPYVVDANGRLNTWFVTNNSVIQQKSPGTRATWQLASRANVGVYVQVSLKELLTHLGSEQQVLNWFDALGRHLPVTGVVFEDADDWLMQLHQPSVVIQGPWDIRGARRALSLDGLSPSAKLALQAFRRVERYRPTIDLVGVVSADQVDVKQAAWPKAPSAVDFVLVKDQANWRDRLPAWQWSGESNNLVDMRRVGLWMGDLRNMEGAVSLNRQADRYLANGGSVLGWRVTIDQQLAALLEQIEPHVSAATFPLRF